MGIQDVASELGHLTEEAAARLRQMDEAAAAQRRGPGTWSRKEYPPFAARRT